MERLNKRLDRRSFLKLATVGAGAFGLGYFAERPKPVEADGPANLIAYPVQEKDTLSELAKAFGTTIPEILKRNPRITNPNEIFVGEYVIIPTKGGVGKSPGVIAIPGEQPTPVPKTDIPGLSPETAGLFPFGEKDTKLVVPPNSATWYKLPTLWRDGKFNRYNMAFGGDIQNLAFQAYGPERSPKNWWGKPDVTPPHATYETPSFGSPDDPNFNGGDTVMKAHFGQQEPKQMYNPDGTPMTDTSWYALLTNSTSSPKNVLVRAFFDFQ